MNIFRLKIGMKRRWRRWRRAIWTTGVCALAAWMAWLGVPLSEKVEQLLTSKSSVVVETLGSLYEENGTLAVMDMTDERVHEWLSELKKTDKIRIVHLNTSYICGEDQRTVLGVMNPTEIEGLLKEHPDWTGGIGAGGDVWLEEHVQGLSDNCYENGYIGIDKNGNLSLFEGPPKDEKVIRTFFQLDVGTMESALPDGVMRQLQQGIRVQDDSEYHSVLSTFSDYAVERSQS